MRKPAATGPERRLCAQALTPLDGILVPTFGAYDLAATFSSSVRGNSFDLSRETEWRLKLLLQLPGSLGAKLAAKGTVLLAGWVVSCVPALMAVALWKSYGGHLHAPETLNLLLGHLPARDVEYWHWR